MLSIGITACTGPTSPVNNQKPVTKDASLKPFGQSGESSTLNDSAERQGKPVVYQVFTRLFGNTNTNNQPWGTIEHNGVGLSSFYSLVWKHEYK